LKRLSRFSWRGLTPQLFVLVVLPLTALLLIITFGGQALHQESMRLMVAERDERAVRAAAGTLREQLNHRASSLRSLAAYAEVEVEPVELASILQEANFLQADFDLGLAFVTSSGEPLAYLGEASLWESLDAALLRSLNDQLDQGTDSALFSASAQSDGRYRMFAAARTRSGTLVIGAFSPSTLIGRALVSVFNPNQGGVAFLVDHERRVLYQIGQLPEGEIPMEHPGVQEALSGQTGAIFLQVGSREHVIAYTPVTPVGWALVIEEPWDLVASPQLRLSERAPLVLIPVLLLALVALWFGTRRIVQPLQELESRAGRLAWGDFTTIEQPVGGIAEIRRLQNELVHLAHKVKSAQEGLRGYINAITMGQEEERRRLARELHDDTLQSLIALNQRVQLAHLSLDSHPEAGALAEIESLIEQAIQNLRRFTRALRPIYLEDLGLATALQMLVRESQAENGPELAFRQAGQERRLAPTTELALYRIAQEALNNVLRHSQAARAELSLIFTPQELILEVSDNGTGFEVPESPAEFSPGGHFGLLGMHERAELIGARLEIASQTGLGTQVQVRLTSNPEATRLQATNSDYNSLNKVGE